MSLDVCPHCSASLLGDPIPREERAELRATHFRREFGVEVRGVYDGVLFWACPDCGGCWHRFPVGHPYRERAEPHMLRYAATVRASAGEAAR